MQSSFPGTSITNTATVKAPNTNCVPGSTDPACSATDTTDVRQPAPITITKVTSNTTPKPGQAFTYTVQVTNTSATTTATATFNDPIPASLVNASWTCAASTGSSCGTTSGTGNITNVALTLQPLGVATFTITVTVDPAFQGGPITNNATATPGTHTVCKVNPAATSCPADVHGDLDPRPGSADNHQDARAGQSVTGWSDHLHGDGHQHQHLDDRPRHLRRSRPGADRRRRGLDDDEDRYGYDGDACQCTDGLPLWGCPGDRPGRQR